MLDGNVLDHWDNRFAWYKKKQEKKMKYKINCDENCLGIAWLIIPLEVEIKHGWFLFHSWNLFVAICAIPSLMLGSWLFFFPESPKFLIECGETDEALEILRDMYQENSGRDRSEYPVTFKFTSKLFSRIF